MFNGHDIIAAVRAGLLVLTDFSEATPPCVDAAVVLEGAQCPGPHWLLCFCFLSLSLSFFFIRVPNYTENWNIAIQSCKENGDCHS